MKYLKIFAVAVVAMFGVNTAKAQVSISAQIGTPAPVVYEEPVYVAPRPVYHRPPRRVVVVERRHYRPRYHRPVLVSRRSYYHRPAHRPVLMRRHH
ncbi:hypothetical protein D0C36_06015 [Mucilaginibacter conchicola]|uniref:Virulence factor n=1 Tax=Mucilaginibacter conchicola TaxID=2303333 RepID=A0A372NYW0_9SPHI|nr:hypothetical protein [Mucilaginibacter conchicola]RFZ95081.1 hypothetical protein D0C36_06015 [Mucilaginibacter conchicola]